MSRGFYDFILRLIEKIESLLVKGTIALIILLITVQVALNDPLNADLNLGKLPLVKEIPLVEKIVSYLEPVRQQARQANDFKKPASKPVLEAEQGVIELRALNLSPGAGPRIKVLVNGQLRGNFKGERVRIFVQDSDEIILDAREIKEGLWFEITKLSDNIQNHREGEQLWVKDDLRSLGEVKLKKRY